MKIRYVVFDFNGTLTNDAEIGFKSCNHMLKWYGKKEVSLKRFLDTFTIPWINFYIANGVHKESIDIEKHQDEYQKYHKSLLKKELKVKKGVIETLAHLKAEDIKLGVLSARNSEQLSSDLSNLGISKLFDSIIGEDSIYHDGTRLEKNVEKLMTSMRILDPSAVLYVGDMVVDIKVAKEHGFVSAVMGDGWQSKDRLLEHNPDYFLEQFKEILDIIKKGKK